MPLLARPGRPAGRLHLGGAAAPAALALLAACSGRGPSVDRGPGPAAHAEAGTGAVAAGSGDPAPPSAPRAAIDAAPPPPDAPLPTLDVVDAPIAWPAERDALMLDYRRTHVDPDATDTVIVPRMIVLHYTAGGSATGTRRYFDRIHLEKARAGLRKGGAVNVSAHFLVDRDGTIYQLMPATRMARHAIGVNHLSIGVENVGDEDRWKLTDAQVEADAALIRWLVAHHPTITRVVGHYEVRSLEGTDWFIERDPSYRNRKSDPGARFMAAVRARIADLGLDGAAQR